MTDNRPLAVKNLEEQDLDQELMLYSGEDDSVHVLNETARFVWKLCDGTNTRKYILHRVREHFHVPDGKNLSRDVCKILEDLEVKGLLK